MTVNDASSNIESSLPLKHGIADRESGILRAAEARQRMTNFAAKAMPPRLEFGVASMTLMSLLTRAQAFHDGALGSLRDDNPWATFTLIRSYAENAAILLRLTERPDDIERLYPETPRDQRLRVGQITHGAGGRLDHFKDIYDQLSGFAHPSPDTALSAWHASERDDGSVQWKTVPAFKNDDDFKMACVWLVELAEANAHLWRECYEMYFGPKPTAIAPAWIPPSERELGTTSHD